MNRVWKILFLLQSIYANESHWKRMLQKYHVMLIPLLAYGLLNGISEVIRLQGTNLDGDTVTYIALAKGLSWLEPYSTSVREPVWIWLVKLVISMSSDEHMALRYLGLFSFLVSGILVYFLTFTQTKSVMSAGFAGLIFFHNHFLANLAARGLRDVGFMTLMLALVLVVLNPNFRLRLKTSLIFTSLISAFLIGVRINAIALVAACVIWIWLRYKVTLLKAILPLVIAVVCIAPYLIYCKKTFDDPLFSANIHARWWRNYEFVVFKKTGCDGCPTLSDLQTNMYAGSAVSATQYIFGMRTPESLLKSTLVGYWSLFAQRTSSYFTGLLGTDFLPVVLCFWFGIFETIRRRFRWILLPPLIVMNFIPFTATLDMDPRIFTPFAPFHSFMLAIGMSGIIIIAVNFLGYLLKLRSQQINTGNKLPLISQ